MFNRPVKFYKIATILAIFSGLAGGTNACLAAEVKMFRDIRMTPERNPVSESQGELRADAREVADLLKIRPMVERLRGEKQRGVLDTLHLSKPMQQARLLCLWKIFVASQEVRKATAQIHYDLAESYASVEKLQARQNMTINMISTYNFMQGGTLGTIKQSLGLHGVGQAPRQEIAEVGFGTSTVLGLVNLLIPSFFREKISGGPNSLSLYTNSANSPADADRSYLWKYLDSTIPGTQLKRREILVKHWQDFARLNTEDAITVRQVSASPNADEKLSEGIRTIKQRLTLLHDLETHIEEFDGCLYELHQAISFN